MRRRKKSYPYRLHPSNTFNACVLQRLQAFLELFPKSGDLAYDEDGEWVYYNGEWFPSDAYDLE
jgi:hypothetical protein